MPRAFSWKEIWVPTWPIPEILLRATLVYFALHILFRTVGRREWTRYATSDVVVLFMISVALRTTLVGQDSSLTGGLISMSTLLFWDWVMSYVTFKSVRMANFINGKPYRLVENGRFNRRAMSRMRVSEDDLLEQVRQKGHSSLQEIEEAYLERSGKISIRFHTKETVG
jgi:uncharacterized membrane protein YcaP (DUF421 family)